MNQDLLFFVQLVIFLVGTLLYGFIARELLRHPSILSGLPMRLLAGCLATWYAGCLVDGLGQILLAEGFAALPVSRLLGLVRGSAWLVSFPLLTHTVWRVTEENFGRWGTGAPRNSRVSLPRFWIVPGYLTLLLFVPAAWDFWRAGDSFPPGPEVYLRVVVHTVVNSLAAGWMLVRAIRGVGDPRVAQFLRWLLPALGAMVLLVSLRRLLELGGLDPGWPAQLWRISAESSGLVLGLTFLYFVQRYNLLRLSLSYRSLRHFLGILALVALVMVSGPAVGVEGTEVFKRLVAWGLVLAVVVGSLYTPLRKIATRRFQWLRRLLGESITAEEIERLSRRIQSFDLAEEEMRRLAAEEIARWLVARADFLARPTADDGTTAALWRHFQDPASPAFNRLGAPSSELVEVLNQTDLHAVFPLRVAGELDGVLGLAVSATGGGYQDGEMEAVRLVLRQLAAAIEVRRLVEARLAQERRLAEYESLSLLGMVAASLAHELKNPLSSMKALAQTVREELEATDPQSDRAQDLGIIVEQIDRLDGVAREILDFARIPKTDPEGQGIDLTALLRRTLYVLSHQTRKRGIELDQREVREVGLVRGTSATWQTVLLNLMVNAVDHAPPGSTVKARLVRQGERVVFHTENSGPPMAPKIARHLFEPWKSDGGTGLGLSLVAQRVRQLGGEIAVENEPDRIRFRVTV